MHASVVSPNRLTTGNQPRENGQGDALNKEIIHKLRAPYADPSQSQAWDEAL